MGLKLRGFVGALKDAASLGRAALQPTPSPSSAHLAVLRATPHLPSSEPPAPRHLDALLSFGRGSRLAAAALVSALADRLRSTTDPAVALKALLALHHLLSQGAFILRDQLPPAFLRQPSSGRNPLALASFPPGRSSSSWALAAWVRWFARLLELLLRLPDPDPDRISALLNPSLLAEIDSLAAVTEEIRRAPEASSAIEGNNLIREAVRLAEEEWAATERGVWVRIKEVRERLGTLGFADSVELVCVLRRLDVFGDRPSYGKWDAWDWRLACDIRELRERTEVLVTRKEEEERRVRRERASSSARIVDRVPDRLREPAWSASTRWLTGELPGKAGLVA